MDYNITLSSDDYKWLKGLISRSVTKAEQAGGSSPLLESAEYLYSVNDSLANAKKVKTSEDEIKVISERKTQPKLCSKHPTYGASRRPRTSCKTCWTVYKDFHPMEYEAAKRDFDRKQKKKKKKKKK